MIYWLLIIILAYFFFSLSFLGDKLILSGPPNPKSYTFYIGILNIFVVLLIPFANISFPAVSVLPWIILQAAVSILGLYFMFSALEKFEVSFVASAIGSIQPIFIFILTFLVLGSYPVKLLHILAFILLLIGGAIISIEKSAKITKDHLKLISISALMFSLEYVFSKIVFLNLPFLQGFFWMRLFAFAFVLLFLFSSQARKEIFQKKNFTNKNVKFVFLFGQMSGGIAAGLQSFAIYLAPIVFLPFINALRGVQYIFIFAITLFFSYFYPKILKENISKTLIIKKLISILFIIFGLALLSFS